MVNKDETMVFIKNMESRKKIPALINLMNANRVCEIGVKQGDHIRAMLGSKADLIIAIDIWRDDGSNTRNDTLSPDSDFQKWYQEMVKLERDNNGRLLLIRDYSFNISNIVSDESFDFIYIDADHSYKAVRQDIEEWWPKVVHNGVLSGHDYSRGMPNGGVRFGVIDAVDEFVKDNKLELNFHVTKKDPNNSWFIYKD